MKFFKFNEFTALFTILYISIIHAMKTVRKSLPRVKSNSLDQDSIFLQRRSKIKKQVDDIERNINIPMILAGMNNNDLSIQSYGSFTAKSLFFPNDELEANGW